MKAQNLTRNRLKLTMLILISLGLVSCNQAGSTGSNSNVTTTISATPKPLKSAELLKSNLLMQRLGSGYDTSSNSVTSSQSCLINATPENIDILNPSGSLRFEEQQGLSGLENDLGVNVSGEYGAGRFSASLAADFANASKNNAYTTNIIYLYKYATTAKFKPNALGQGLSSLTPTAAILAQDAPAEFRAMCGDTYIAQMDAGSVLAVRLQLSFNSHQDQEKLDVSAMAKFGLGSIATKIQQAATSQNVHVSFSLSALQLGGQPEKLNELFGNQGPSGNYPFLDCGSVNGSNEAACNQMMNSIVTYAQTMETQLHNSNGELNNDRLYYTNPVTSPYYIESAEEPSPEIFAAMRSLTAGFDKTKEDYDFVNHYRMILADSLDTPTTSNLLKAENKLSAQLHNVYLDEHYKVIDCYKGYVSNKCITIKQEVDRALNEEDLKLTDTEASLINYLEKNAYKADLYNYYGTNGSDIASDYKISTDDCILAPVSSPSRAKFAVNCEGQWLNLAGTLIIKTSGFGGLSITGLSYYSNNHGFTKLISYPDVVIPADSSDPNDYYTDGLDVTGGASFMRANTALEVVRWDDGNPA